MLFSIQAERWLVVVSSSRLQPIGLAEIHERVEPGFTTDDVL